MSRAARMRGTFGIAAAVVCVIVAGAVTYAFLSRDAGSSARHSGSSSVEAAKRSLQAADGSVHQATRSVRAATKPASAASNAPLRTSISTGGLSIQATWPTFPGCDGATTQVAVTRAGPSLSALKASPEFADDAAAFNVGHLFVGFSVAGNAVAQIKDIQPIIYRVSSQAPTRVYYLEGQGCESASNRALQLDLDARTLTDESAGGDHDDDDDDGDTPPGVTVAPLDLALRVSATHPIKIRIDVDGCSASYRWGLEINYVIGGRDFVRLIGTRRDPFRVMAGANNPIPAYGINLASRDASLHWLGNLESSASCQVQFSRH
jgi:hypothetical protein